MLDNFSDTRLPFSTEIHNLLFPFFTSTPSLPLTLRLNLLQSKSPMTIPYLFASTTLPYSFRNLFFHLHFHHYMAHIKLPHNITLANFSLTRIILKSTHSHPMVGFTHEHINIFTSTTSTHIQSPPMYSILHKRLIAFQSCFR